jgi:sugar phosphate isomerase/epimerase
MGIWRAYFHVMKGIKLPTTRREFVQILGLVAATSAFSQVAEPRRLPIAFSTLGCPAWPLTRILDFAGQHGFAAVELRGLEGNLDLPSHPAFSAPRMAQSKRDIAAHGLKIACVSSSASMNEADPGKRAKVLEEARSSIDLAAALEAPYIRVFGNSSDSEKHLVPDQQLKARVASGLRELGEYAGTRHVTVLLESHDDFTSSAVLEDVFHQANSEHVGLLWDAYHTYTAGNEDPESTVKKLGRWIHHTHLKDATGSGTDRHYVLTGQGNIPIKRQIAALHSLGYTGYYCFEWEKLWHPDLQDPDIAFADYARVMSGYLREIGVK